MVKQEPDGLSVHACVIEFNSCFDFPHTFYLLIATSKFNCWSRSSSSCNFVSLTSSTNWSRINLSCSSIWKSHLTAYLRTSRIYLSIDSLFCSNLKNWKRSNTVLVHLWTYVSNVSKNSLISNMWHEEYDFLLLSRLVDPINHPVDLHKVIPFIESLRTCKRHRPQVGNERIVKLSIFWLHGHSNK